ncbi:30S ribosomal protein S15 [Patescibacteria group bacterium]|nr:30S ribosomal protein S15 [Patescibacteria group bacterium]
MLEINKKQEIIKKFATHENDTGSAEVQIAILTEEIKQVTKHLQEHKQDFSSKRGLIRKIGQRKRMLKKLKVENPESYLKLVKELGIRG